jgi:sugar O-acyltransferase (sialic acid O-acetyltransferase NeuD family)
MASPTPIVIWGAAGHAKVVADVLRATAQFELVGLIDDTAPQRRGELHYGIPILGGREMLDALLANGTRLMFGFGDNAARLRIGAEMAARGFVFPTLVHPSAVVSPTAQIGAGSFVAAGAVVNSDARVGAQVIVNSGAIVEHDNEVGDGVHLSPRACLSGWVRVGRASWIGSGAVVRDRITIGERCVVGVGSVVVADIPDAAMAYGCPARVVRALE